MTQENYWHFQSLLNFHLHFFFHFYRRSEEEDTMVAPYGRQVDVSQLTDEECSQILNVISKDILLRKSEKERIT